MAVYTSTETWATESGVFAYAAYTFTGQSEPTNVEVYGFARDVCAILVVGTEKWGSRQVPPYSGADAVGLGRLLQQANEIGAAFLARHAMYVLNGDDRSLIAMQRLQGYWQSFVGQGAQNVSSGLGTLRIGEGGTIQQAIGTSGGSFLLQADVTMGDVSLADHDSIEVDYPFKASTVD